MDAPNEQHLKRIVSEFSLDLEAKYRAGQEEHGGDLWTKPGMLSHAIEEVLDMVVYLYTLRDQLRARDINI